MHLSDENYAVITAKIGDIRAEIDKGLTTVTPSPLALRRAREEVDALKLLLDEVLELEGADAAAEDVRQARRAVRTIFGMDYPVTDTQVAAAALGLTVVELDGFAKNVGVALPDDGVPLTFESMYLLLCATRGVTPLFMFPGDDFKRLELARKEHAAELEARK